MTTPPPVQQGGPVANRANALGRFVSLLGAFLSPKGHAAVTTPATSVVVVEDIAGKLIAAGVKDLIPLAEGALPLPIEALVKGLLALPPVQDEIARLEAAAVGELGVAVTAVEQALAKLAAPFLRAHPALASLWAKLEGSPVLGEAVSFAADEVKAFFQLKTSGRWGEVRAFLVQAGLLPAP